MYTAIMSVCCAQFSQGASVTIALSFFFFEFYFYRVCVGVGGWGGELRALGESEIKLEFQNQILIHKSFGQIKIHDWNVKRTTCNVTATAVFMLSLCYYVYVITMLMLSLCFMFMLS